VANQTAQRMRYAADNAYSGVIVFDGVCRLCNGWTRFVIRYDRQKQFRLAPAQSPAGQALLRRFERPTTDFDSILYVEHGRAYDKSDAVLRILRRLGLPWSLLYVGRLCPRILRDALYDLVARHRYRLFGRYDYCTLATPDHDRRFLHDTD